MAINELNEEDRKQLAKLKTENIHLSKAGQSLLEERQAAEMLEAAKESHKYWQGHIDNWNKTRRSLYRGFGGFTLGMVIEIYSRTGDLNTACRICQVCIKTVKKISKESEEVRDALEEARALFAGRVQAKLTDIVFNGMKEKIYDKDGNLTKVIHKESEQLIKLAAEGAMPDKYGRKKDGGAGPVIPIQINLYLDKDEEENGASPRATVQLDAERLPDAVVEVSDEGISEGDKE